MALTQLAPPYPIFTDKNGDPLDNGYLYFGEVNKNPETNPIQVYYDSALTQPAAQPLRTSNGYVMRNGSPSLIYSSSQFSVTVRDKNNALVIYSPVGYGVDPASVTGSVNVQDYIGDGTTTTYAMGAFPSTINATNVYIDGIYQEKDTYTISGTSLTFSAAPPINSGIEIVVQESAILGGASAQQISYNQSGVGAVSRTVKSKLQEFVSVKDFGAVGDGVTDDTTAIQNAIDYAATVITSGSADLDQVTASVVFPAGKYRTTAPIEMKNGVQFRGAGSNATWILVDHSGNGFFSASGSTYFGIQVYGMHLESNGSAQDGFVIDGQIRNCYYHDVGGRGFRRTFSVTSTWTVVFDQCYSFGATNHFYLINVGGVHIYHGRYDVASDHGVYMDSANGELIMQDAAVQFGSKSAVYVKNCYTVELNQCFFEGNCIGSLTDYYVYISNDVSRSLSSASVTNCVMNNTADPNRDGLGVLFIQQIQGFNYIHRWTRNGVNSVPEVGPNVPRVNITHNGSNNMSSVYGNVGAGTNGRAIIDQIGRPYQVFGQDMADASLDPKVRAAMNVGFWDKGIAIGTYSSVGAMQAYGSSFLMRLNPGAGDVSFGSTGLAKVDAGTNDFRGRYTQQAQISASNLTPNSTTQYVLIDCSLGGRSVDMANIANGIGATFTIGKRDGTTNPLIVTPASGTINGAATLTLNTAYEHKTIICDGTDWFVLQ